MIKKNVQGSYHFELSNELNIFFFTIKSQKDRTQVLKRKNFDSSILVVYMIYYDVVQLTSLTLFGEIELKY